MKKELSGNFERVVVGLMMKPSEYDAYCLHKAMRGAGTDESVSFLSFVIFGLYRTTIFETYVSSARICTIFCLKKR